jgi:chromosome segregation ATPase
MSEQCQQNSEELAKITKVFDELKVKHDKLIVDMKSKTDESTKLADDVKKSNELNAKYEQDVKALKVRIEELTDEFLEKEENLNQAIEDLSADAEQFKELKPSVDALTAALAKMQDDHVTKQTEWDAILKQKDTAIKAKSDVMDLLNKEHDLLIKKTAEAATVNKQHEQHIASLTKQVNSLEAELAEAKKAVELSNIVQTKAAVGDEMRKLLRHARTKFLR